MDPVVVLHDVKKTRLPKLAIEPNRSLRRGSLPSTTRMSRHTEKSSKPQRGSPRSMDPVVILENLPPSYTSPVRPRRNSMSQSSAVVRTNRRTADTSTPLSGKSNQHIVSPRNSSMSARPTRLHTRSTRNTVSDDIPILIEDSPKRPSKPSRGLDRRNHPASSKQVAVDETEQMKWYPLRLPKSAAGSKRQLRTSPRQTPVKRPRRGSLGQDQPTVELASKMSPRIKKSAVKPSPAKQKINSSLCNEAHSSRQTRRSVEDAASDSSPEGIVPILDRFAAGYERTKNVQQQPDEAEKRVIVKPPKKRLSGRWQPVPVALSQSSPPLARVPDDIPNLTQLTDSGANTGGLPMATVVPRGTRVTIQLPPHDIPMVITLQTETTLVGNVIGRVPVPRLVDEGTQTVPTVQVVLEKHEEADQKYSEEGTADHIPEELTVDLYPMEGGDARGPVNEHAGDCQKTTSVALGNRKMVEDKRSVDCLNTGPVDAKAKKPGGSGSDSSDADSDTCIHAIGYVICSQGLDENSWPSNVDGVCKRAPTANGEVGTNVKHPTSDTSDSETVEECRSSTSTSDIPVKRSGKHVRDRAQNGVKGIGYVTCPPTPDMAGNSPGNIPEKPSGEQNGDPVQVVGYVTCPPIVPEPAGGDDILLENDSSKESDTISTKEKCAIKRRKVSRWDKRSGEKEGKGEMPHPKKSNIESPQSTADTTGETLGSDTGTKSSEHANSGSAAEMGDDVAGSSNGVEQNEVGGQITDAVGESRQKSSATEEPSETEATEETMDTQSAEEPNNSHEYLGEPDPGLGSQLNENANSTPAETSDTTEQSANGDDLKGTTGQPSDTDRERLEESTMGSPKSPNDDEHMENNDSSKGTQSSEDPHRPTATSETSKNASAITQEGKPMDVGSKNSDQLAKSNEDAKVSAASTAGPPESPDEAGHVDDTPSEPGEAAAADEHTDTQSTGDADEANITPTAANEKKDAVHNEGVGKLGDPKGASTELASVPDTSRSEVSADKVCPVSDVDNPEDAKAKQMTGNGISSKGTDSSRTGSVIQSPIEKGASREPADVADNVSQFSDDVDETDAVAYPCYCKY